MKPKMLSLISNLCRYTFVSSSFSHFLIISYAHFLTFSKGNLYFVATTFSSLLWKQHWRGCWTVYSKLSRQFCITYVYIITNINQKCANKRSFSIFNAAIMIFVVWYCLIQTTCRIARQINSAVNDILRSTTNTSLDSTLFIFLK